MKTRLTALAAALLLSVTALAQDQQAIRQQFFGATDEVKTEADALDAVRLAPESYAAGLELYESAGDTLADGRDLDKVREELAEATQHFERAVEAATLARTTFADALTAREAAEKAEAGTYAARDWERAEESLLEAARVLEGGNLRRATEMGADSEKRYRETEATAINERSKAD